LTATALTEPACPDGSGATSQTLTVLSTDADARYEPSRLKATELTQSRCPRRFWASLAVPPWSRHSLTRPSAPAEARHLPSRRNATELGGPVWPVRVGGLPPGS